MIRTNKTKNVSLECYLREIGTISLLTPEEEILLAKKIKDGDQEALEKLTTANLRFVVSIANKYQNRGLPLGDLINEGNLGLIKAAKRFDETRGFKFISYAVWWIRQAVLQALAEQSSVIRLPLNRVGALNKISKAFNNLEQEFEREPCADEIARELDMTEYEVTDNLKRSNRPFSLDAPLRKGEDNKLLDLIENDHEPLPDDFIIYESRRTEIQEVLTSLTDREATIIKLYFGMEGDRSYNLEEIGQRFHLTRERVRQIKEKGLRKLRHKSRARILKKYMD